MALPSVYSTGRRRFSLPEALEEAPPAAAAAPAGSKKILKVPVDPQKKDDWCWAAVSLGIRAAYGLTVSSQCQFVGKILKGETINGRVHEGECCPRARQRDCVTPHELTKPLGQHHAAPLIEENDPSVSGPGHRTFAFVKGQIDDGHPIAVRIHWRTPGGGHFVVIKGYRQIGTSISLYICDPKSPHQNIVPFDEFLSAYERDGFWHVSYRTQESNLNPGRVPAEP